MNAVRTWNKLFFQNGRSAICSHHTILLSKEQERICFSKEGTLLCSFSFSRLISYVSMGKLCKSDLYSSLKLCFVAVKSEEAMTDWSMEEQVGTEQTLSIFVSTWWHSRASNTQRELYLFHVKLTLNRTWISRSNFFFFFFWVNNLHFFDISQILVASLCPQCSLPSWALLII